MGGDSPLGTLYTLFSERTTLGAFITVLATDVYACYRANSSFPGRNGSRRSGGNGSSNPAERLLGEAQQLGGGAALLAPIFAAGLLLALFFFIGAVGAALAAASAISGLAALAYALWPFGEVVVRLIRRFTHNFRFLNHENAPAIFVLPIVVILVLCWMFTGSWVVNNLIGMSLCVLFAAMCRVPSVKVTSVLYTGLFIYDVFFVFFSKYFFGKNIMVEVANSTPTNPASALADWLHLPMQPVKTLALPAKLIFPDAEGNQAILGLGDIILPIVLLVYLLEFDSVSGEPLRNGYFARGVFWHLFGLMMSFYFNIAYDVAQPALLYIVPAMIISTVVVAKSRGHLETLWSGSFRNTGFSALPTENNADMSLSSQEKGDSIPA